MTDLTAKQAQHSPARFTPGPWTLETVRTSVGVCHKIGKLGSSTKINNACLYDDCYSATPRDMQLLADARLIALAPDMFAKLETLYSWLDDIGDGAPDASPTERRALNEAAEIRRLLDKVRI